MTLYGAEEEYKESANLEKGKNAVLKKIALEFVKFCDLTL